MDYHSNSGGKGLKYHLHWELDGLTAQPIVGFCRSGELFGFLGFGDAKTKALQTISSSQRTPGSNVTLFANGEVSQPQWRSSYLDASNDNILYNNLTVIETLMFSSDLRLPNAQHHEITALRLLTAMELDHISDTRISHLSSWQRRMIVFATEIVSARDMIFFDRPTFDLDATSALACVTALQRVARTGCLIAITSDFLSFREYAILDRIQLLSDNGAVYFGAGARAVSYFEQFGRTPSPGASIPDFLFYLVDDLNSGFLDSSAMIKATIIQNKNISKHLDNYVRREQQAGSKARASMERAYLRSRKDQEVELHRLTLQRTKATSVYGRVVDAAKWVLQCGCLDTEEEDLCTQPLVSRQLLWCLWRAFAIRARNTNHLLGLLYMIGIMLPIGLVIVFDGRVGPGSVVGDLNRCLLLTILPYCIALMGVIWNEDDVQDRVVFAFERGRQYYFPIYFPLSAVVADIVVFKLLPSTVACIIIVPMLSLKTDFSSILRLLHALFLVSVVSTCLAKAVFNALAVRSTFNAAKASLFSCLVLSMQLLYAGMFFGLQLWDTDKINERYSQKLLGDLSLFKWVCGVLYWNEFHHLAEDITAAGNATSSSSDNTVLVTLVDSLPDPNESFACLWLMALAYCVLSVIFTLVFHK